MRVLIAEDDAVSRTILKRAVERLGYEVLATADGQEAWDSYRLDPSSFDVVISDWMMPGIDGVALCRRIRSHQDSREGYPFFVFLTALGDKEHLLEGMRAGADDYLRKPLDRDELGARLAAASRVIGLQRQLLAQKGELERLNAELAELARRDPLTGLGNRLRLREDLEMLGAHVGRYGHSYCAVLYDVDFFKAYNDLYGHLAGDEVLRKVANTILETVRAGDASYRYGGEEFLVLLPEQTINDAHAAAERVLAAVRGLDIEHKGSPKGVVTVSCGMARLAPGGDATGGGPGGSTKAAETLLRRADRALYRAKEAGRDTVEVYEEGAPKNGASPQENPAGL